MQRQHIQTKIEYFKKLKSYVTKELEQLETLKKRISQTGNINYLNKICHLEKITQLRNNQLQLVIQSHTLMLASAS